MLSFIAKLFSVVVLAVSSVFVGHPAGNQSSVANVETAASIHGTATSTATSTPAVIQSAPAPVSHHQVQEQEPVTPSIQQPPANSELCNGSYYSECATGNDFVCPQTGTPYCQPSAATLQAQQQAKAQQAAEQAQEEQKSAQEQEQQQEAALQPLISQFNSTIGDVNSACANAVRSTAVTTCEQTESKLLPILQQEAAAGISVQEAYPELQELESSYNTLQSEYYAIAEQAIPEEYIQAEQANVASEMQILGNDESMFSH